MDPTPEAVAAACREWGFFQAVNHGVAAEAVEGMRRVWREFFENVSVEEKRRFANDPVSYQGYGSRLGVEKGAVLDWGDYFYLEVFPEERRVFEKWPGSCRYVWGTYRCLVIKYYFRKLYQKIKIIFL